MKKLIFFLLFILINPNLIYSQFLPTSGPSGGAVYSIVVSGSNVFAATETGGVYRSSNNGDNWVQVVNGMGAQRINWMKGSGGTLYAGGQNGLYKSVNNGDNWMPVNFGASSDVTALEVYGSDIYVGTSGGMLYKSTNSGTDWNILPGTSGTVRSIAVFENILFVAAIGVYATSNGGANWYHEYIGGGPQIELRKFYVINNILRLGSFNGGKKKSTLMGGWATDIPWISVVWGGGQINNYAISVGLGGMYWSSDYGNSWHDPVAGYLLGVNLYSMDKNSQYVFAGGTTVYRRPISQFTGLNIISTNVPENYELSQNYPNPFNPGTNIKFSIPATSNVNLEIFNQVGQSVKVLVNEDLAAGTYEYYFDASSLSSGIYLYTVSAGEFTQTKKMILIK